MVGVAVVVKVLGGSGVAVTGGLMLFSKNNLLLADSSLICTGFHTLQFIVKLL